MLNLKKKNQKYVHVKGREIDFLVRLCKRERIPKGQSKMNNPEKLATQGAQVS